MKAYGYELGWDMGFELGFSVDVVMVSSVIYPLEYSINMLLVLALGTYLVT